MKTIFQWDEATNRIEMTKGVQGSVNVNIKADSGIEISDNTVALITVTDGENDYIKKASALTSSDIGWSALFTVLASDVSDMTYGYYLWDVTLITNPAYDVNGIPYADERSGKVVKLWNDDDRPKFVLEDATILEFVVSDMIETLVPRFLRNDKNGYALTCAIQAAATYFADRIRAALINLLDVSGCEEWRLDELAWEYAVEWYDYGDDVDTKRSVIAAVMKTFGTLGTVDSVVNVLEEFFDSAYIQEWWQYNGDAGHFKVITNDVTQTDKKAKMTQKMIAVAKRAGAILDEISVQGSSGTASTNLMTAAVPVSMSGISAIAN